MKVEESIDTIIPNTLNNNEEFNPQKSLKLPKIKKRQR